MAKYSHRLLTIVLCLTMLLGLSACNNKKDVSLNESSNKGNNKIKSTSDAMGRYVEQEEYLPEEVLSVLSITQLSDGSLKLLADLGGQGIGPYGMYTSKDSGKSWSNIDYPWLDSLVGCPIVTAAISNSGVYIAHTENVIDQAPEDESSADSEQSSDIIDQDKSSSDTSFTFVYGDENGVNEIPFDPTSENDNIIGTTLYTAVNGDLISVSLSGQILQIDTKNWKEKNQYSTVPGVGILPGVATYDDKIAINAGDKISLYSLEDGSAIGEIPTTGSIQSSYINQKVSLVSIPSDGSAYFYVNETGLYRVPMDTTVSERLVDGGLSSLAIQNLTFTDIFSVDNEEYLAIARTSEFGYRMFRYVYNPDIPTEPSEVVSVYSLYDNKTIRQSISGYQTQNPDVRINYQVGLQEGGSITAADAMRTLSTELLAGKGPDVIVADEMGINGFIDKNILMDITEVVSTIKTLENVSKTYQQDGKLYAIPARFYIPMLLGDGVDKVTNLSEFTSWLETQYTPDIGMRTDELIDRFYTSCSYRWFDNSGKLDDNAFRSDLEQLGKLADGIRSIDGVESYDNNIAIDTLRWYGGAISASCGVVSGYVDVSLFDSAIQNRKTGSYSPFPSENGGVFVPSTILGINAATESPGNAKNFIQHVLSDEVQATHLGDGFPVNDKAFEELSKDPTAGSAEDMFAQLMVQDSRTGELTEVSLNGKWPSEEFMTEFKNMLRGTTVPVKTNAVIKEMIIDETAGFISGTKSLEETINSFKQKMDLYLSE